MGNSPSIPFADRELATAAEKGNLPRVKFLIEKDGANVNFQDAFGWSPLLHAISEGHLEYDLFSHLPYHFHSFAYSAKCKCQLSRCSHLEYDSSTIYFLFMSPSSFKGE